MTVQGKQGAPKTDLPGLPLSPFGVAPTSLQAVLDGPTFPLDARFPEEDKFEATRKEVIPDDEIYLPFMFQDLRDAPEQFLYFRAFLKDGLSETFVPDWQTENYYGRVDSIPIYKGTTRNISVAFDVVAWQAAELPIIYKKLSKLQSMLYPEYDGKGFLNKGPIIRMRIGDLINGGAKKGIPGYITSLDLAYDDGIWNIETDFKVPRKISISLGFTVLHEGNPGIFPFFPNREFNINDSTPSEAPKDKAFGAAKFTATSKTNMRIDVSRAEIRRIFQSARNK
jgi:hypothetical protein